MASAKKDRKIVVQIANNLTDIDARPSKIKKLIDAVFKNSDADQNSKIVVSIAIVDDVKIRKLNSKFLNRKSATDCLSFDLSDSQAPKSPKTFELIVNGEMAIRQANLRGHSPQAELALYIIHGLLHNLGFDDSTDNKAEKMHETEDKILQQLGYGLVYNKNAKQ
ncbi:MAG: rRNA maturation RNase YbeY [Sedimentisphaerales bacterium]|nr:rRNA maturation RNase YbeY [Sedimentisphaerales bacterium]